MPRRSGWLWLGVLCIIIASCTQEVTPFYPAMRQWWIEVSGTYSNADGRSPVFAPDSQSLVSDQASFDSSHSLYLAPYDTNSAQVRIYLKNLSVRDSMGNTAIDSLVVEEQREHNGRWINDQEFARNFSKLTKIAVVLVLDISTSLGDDYSKVKQYATRFVEIVQRDAPQAKIGVVVFSESIDSLEPTTSISAVNAFIANDRSRKNATALYSAMQTGINMLRRATADGKALVTFTDGIDNYSTVTPDSIIQAIQTNSISSYTVGLQGKGDIDTVVLSSLANREYRTASNVSVLDGIFARFSEVVTNVYEVTYVRNNQVVAPESPYRIRFRFRTAPEQ